MENRLEIPQLDQIKQRFIQLYDSLNDLLVNSERTPW